MLKLITFFCILNISPYSLAGHFENGTQKKLEKAEHKFLAFAEYNSQYAAMIDYQLLTDLNRYDIASAIIKSTKRLWVRVPYQYKTTPDFKVLEDKVKALKGTTFFYEKPEKEVKTGPYNNIWARDWGPFWTRSKFIPKYANIYDFNYFLVRALDDLVPQSLAKILHLPRVSAPLYLQGGNFQTTSDGICFTNFGTVSDNARILTKDDAVYGETEIKTMLKAHLGCREVVIFPESDHDGFFHIDMWMMLLGDRKVAMSTIDKATLERALSLGYGELLEPIQTYLHERREDLLRLGFEIVELPWPIATMRNTYPWDPDVEVDPYLVTNTYANMQILNGNALVPSYKFKFLPDAEQWKTRYEQQVSEVLSRHGINTIFLDSDELAEWEGTIHCVMSNVPKY